MRRILRRLDTLLDAPAAYTGLNRMPSNGRERELRAFLLSLEPRDEGLAQYVTQHLNRIVRTLAMVPAGAADRSALELGSYLHMAAALSRVLHYGTVRGAYYAATPGRDRKAVNVRSQDSFPMDLDLFDAESDAFPYADGAFDVVLCCEIIEHLLHDPMHMLVECRRVLKTDGVLILTTPNIASLSSVAAALDGRYNPQVFGRYPRQGNPDTPHVREYTPFEISGAVRSAGYRVETLVTERMNGVANATWALEALEAGGFETALRGEQLYVVARKSDTPTVNRFPAFLYS